MRLNLRRTYPAIILLLIVATFCRAGSSPKPLINAHAHNDYLHERPLRDALDHGFCSVEADIYLVHGKLLVAHERRELKSERTLQALYLDPLREQIKKNDGRVYAGGPESFNILIDIKSDGEATYAALRAALEKYSDVMTQFGPDGVKQKAITAIISGDRPRATLLDRSVHYAAMDGRIDDLGQDLPKERIPWISESWVGNFRWLGAGGPMPEEQRQKLKSICDKAHAEGRRVRFWGGPDNIDLWKEQLADGVDLLNVDDLGKCQEFFASWDR